MATDVKPLIIKDFPGQAVEEYRKTHGGNLPSDEENQCRYLTYQDGDSDSYFRFYKRHLNSRVKEIRTDIEILQQNLVNAPNTGAPYSEYYILKRALGKVEGLYTEMLEEIQ